MLRKHGLTWTGFVVLWVVWIWDGLETRHAAQNAAISKATLTGVVKTLEARGLITRRVSATDRRLVNLELTPAGLTLMKELYPAFNAAETEVVAGLSPRSLAQLTNSLRSIVAELEKAHRRSNRRCLRPAERMSPEIVEVVQILRASTAQRTCSGVGSWTRAAAAATK